MIEQTSVDICMIVKNEEDNLRLTLENNVACADKVIIVDTGSTDGTKEYCLGKGAHVYDFKWCSDFSAARNYSISRSDARWILWLDADEYIDKRDFEDLKKHLSNSSADIIFVTINECKYGTKEKYTSYKRDKIFRNNAGITFIRPVNEQLARASGETKKEYFPKFQIYHWGMHLPKEKQTKKAMERINEFYGLFNQHKDPYIAFIIAGLLSSIGSKGEAEELYGKILEMTSADAEAKRLLRHAVFVKKSRIHEDRKEYEDAILDADSAISIDPTYIEPYITKSSSYMAMGDHAKAINALIPVTKMEKKDHPVLGEADFLWSVKRHQNLANSYLILGDYSMAETYFKKMLESWDDEKIREILSKLELLKNAGRG